MDSIDDDFGELYVDAKVQGNDAFAGHFGFVKSCQESECASGKERGFEEKVKPDSEVEVRKIDVVTKDSSPSGDACAVNLTVANEEESEYSDSDSEDDSKTMQKEDHSKVPVARGSNINNSGHCVAGAVEESKNFSFHRRRIGRNWCTIPNAGIVNGRMMMNVSANNAYINPFLGMPQYGYSFSHPWFRTPFDVNFNVFENMQWRNHGTHISDFSNFGLNDQSCKPLGRAIQVGGETLERIPSTDLRRRRDSDPDVVIQIPVTNDVEELPIMKPEKARSLNITSIEAYRSGDSRSNIMKDLNSVDDTPDDKNKYSRSLSGEQSPPTEICCSGEVTRSDKEKIKEEKEEGSCNSDEGDPSLVKSESSLGDRIRLTPTSSSLDGKNEESDDYESESLNDSATDDQCEISTSPRRARLEEHGSISINCGDRSGTKLSRPRGSHRDSSKRHCGGAGYAIHGYVKDASPTPDPGRGKKVFSPHRSVHHNSKQKLTERKDVHYYRKKCHGGLPSSVDRARHREHRFGWHNNKKSSRVRGFDHSISYKCEPRPKEYNSRSSFNMNERNSKSSFKEKDDWYGWHHCERHYGHERSPVRAYKNSRERNGYEWLREPYYEDRIPITDMDYRYRSEYSSAFQSPEDDRYFKRRDDYDYNHPRFEDVRHREESRIPFELAYRELRDFAEVERREYLRCKRHEEFSEIEKRQHYIHDWHLYRFVSEEDGYKYRTQKAWPSLSLSLRDSWYTKEPKDDIRRDYTRDFRTAKAYESQNNQFRKATPRDGWMQNLHRSDNVSIKDRLTYDDDRVRLDRGRYKLTGDTQCSMREVTHSENPSHTDEILDSDIRIPPHNRLATKQRSGYFESHLHETDERHRSSKKLRGYNRVDLASRLGKLPNHSEEGFFTIEQEDLQKPGKVTCSRSDVQIKDFVEKEEGEIIEETNGKNVEIDNERIQETLKKMEKRRERFKEIKLAETVEEVTLECQTEQRDITSVTNQQRPVRKRRWCAI